MINERLDGRIKWICEHSIGHTIWSPEGYYVHGCDGCCRVFMGTKIKDGIRNIARNVPIHRKQEQIERLVNEIIQAKGGKHE